MASTLLVLLTLAATAAAIAPTDPPTAAHPSPEPALDEIHDSAAELARLPSGSKLGIHRVFIPSRDKMLMEAITVLRYSGYDMLAMAMEGLEGDLVLLHNMTVFALDDDHSILSDGERYVIVPDQLLKHADLVLLPEGTVLPTLDNERRRLVVTRPGATEAQLLRINGVSIKAPDVFRNAMIVVHGITVPFPEAAAEDQLFVRLLFYLFMVGLLVIVLVLVAVVKAPRGSRLARCQECLEWCCRGLRYSRRYHIVRN